MSENAGLKHKLEEKIKTINNRIEELRQEFDRLDDNHVSDQLRVMQKISELTAIKNEFQNMIKKF